MNLLEKEAVFHDEWAKQIDVSKIDVTRFFESQSVPENKWLISDLRAGFDNNSLLELGCGAGESSVYFARLGARVTATDISPEMLKVAVKLATENGVSIDTVLTGAEDLSVFPDASFDIVYAANLLHHVKIYNCISEVKRVLKPGGIGLFWDPIHYNPIINIYRKLASNVRTEDEHPLRVGDLNNIREIFSNKVTFRFFWFTGLAVFLKYYLVDRLDPNKVRYWKKVVDDSVVLDKFLSWSHKFDQLLFKLCPPLKFLSWNIAIKVEK